MLTDKTTLDYGAHVVEIDDEGDGEFVVVRTQDYTTTEPRLLINPDEWPQLRAAINRAMREIAKTQRR